MTGGVYDAIDAVLESEATVPELATEVEVARFIGRRQGLHGVVGCPETRTYLRLSADELSILDGSLDGVDRASTARLTNRLRAHGMLAGTDVFAALDTHASRSRGPHRHRNRRSGFLTVEFRSVQSVVDAVYRLGGHALFTRWAAAFVGAVSTGGFALFLFELNRPDTSLRSGLSATQASVVIVLSLAAVLLHELCHALAIVRARRRVLSAGFQLYLANPAFFVDSTDMVMASPRQRAVNAAAGLYCDTFVAALATIAGTAVADSDARTTLIRFAGLTYVFTLVNLVPFLELDGYWLMTDLFDLPELRPRALRFLRQGFLPALRGRSLTAEQAVLTGYGVAALACAVLAVAAAWVFWLPVVTAAAGGLWSSGHIGRAAVIVLVFVLGAPAVIDGSRRVSPHLPSRRSVSRSVRFRLQRRWRVEAGTLVSHAAGVGMLSDQTLNAIAGLASRRLVEAGDIVAAQGANSENWLLIRSGRFRVNREAFDGTHDDGVLVRGDTFGTWSLLNDAPYPASVRAESSGQVFTIDRATFHRLLGAPRSVAGASPEASATEWSVDVLHDTGAFSGSDRATLTKIVEAGRWVWLAPDENVSLVADHAGHVIINGRVAEGVTKTKVRVFVTAPDPTARREQEQS